MDSTHVTLLERIAAYRFDPPGAEGAFLSRLMDENAWTQRFAERAIEEYRRFAFLSVVRGEGVSPSDIVDQVWHLHLIYTRMYWDEFCGKVLGRRLHHDPATGLTGEGKRLHGMYEGTLRTYREFFGEPPSDIWPVHTSDSPKPRYQRIDVNQTLILPKSAGRLMLGLIGAGAIGIIIWWALNAVK